MLDRLKIMIRQYLRENGKASSQDIALGTSHHVDDIEDALALMDDVHSENGLWYLDL